MARYRLEALQRGKRPAYLFIEWDEEVDGGAKEHSIVEGKATALMTGSNSFIPGGRVLCKLPEGDFPATILCAGSRTECFEAQMEMETALENQLLPSDGVGDNDNQKERQDLEDQEATKVTKSKTSIAEKDKGGKRKSKKSQKQISAKAREAAGKELSSSLMEEIYSSQDLEEALHETSKVSEAVREGSDGPEKDKQPGEVTSKGSGAETGPENTKNVHPGISKVSSLEKDCIVNPGPPDIDSEINNDEIDDVFVRTTQDSTWTTTTCKPTDIDATIILDQSSPLLSSTPQSKCSSDTRSSLPSPQWGFEGVRPNKRCLTGDYLGGSDGIKRARQSYIPGNPSYGVWGPASGHPAHPGYFTSLHHTPGPSSEKREEEDVSDVGSMYSGYISANHVDPSLAGLTDLMIGMNSHLASLSASVQCMSTEILHVKEHLRRAGLKKRKSDERERGTVQSSEVRESTSSGAIFGDPNGSGRQRVLLSSVMQGQVTNAERRSTTQEQLASSLLLLLFSVEELRTGNCTKPIRDDIQQLDTERLWAIKCHIEFRYPLPVKDAELETENNQRWTRLLQKTLNPKCRQLRNSKPLK